MSKPRTATQTFPVSSPKWRACCAREGVSCTPISADLDFSQLYAAMADAPMRLLSERVINAEVLRGLDNLAPRYLDLVGHHLPACLRPFGRLFVGAPGSLMYRELQRGRLFVPDVLLRQGLSRLSRTGAPALGGSRDGRRRGALFELRSAISAGCVQHLMWTSGWGNV